MSAEIKALRCPSCGNPANVAARELRFGYEFKCTQCGTVSVLIINNQLYVRRGRERVCPYCGRVAARTDRYCQCEKSLIRQCRKCGKETFIDNRICSHCGWPR